MVMTGKLSQEQHQHLDMIAALNAIAEALSSRAFGDAPTYMFTVERSGSGFITRILAEPVDGD